MSTKLLYVEDVANYFRQICAEPDASYLTDANVATALSLAYEDFRDYVTSVKPGHFATRVYVNVASATYKDLSSTLFAQTENGTRAKYIVAVYVCKANDTTDLYYQLRPMGSLEALRRSAESGYYLEGQTIHFGEEKQTNICIIYVPESTVDWTQLDSGDNAYIDELIPYHDLIALMAYRHFELREAVQHDMVEKHIARRKRDLAVYLNNRLYGSGQYTDDVMTYGDRF